jgi:ribosomal protein L11 methyltransferase
MPWRALKLQVDGAAAEAFSDALLEAGAQSVFVDPGRAVVATLSLDQDSRSLIDAAALAAGIPSPGFTSEEVADQDWVRATQAQFTPILVGTRLWVGPSWHEPPAGRVVVRIDPGLAFGTGTHPSTRLMLAWLERTVRGGERVLDYGCGSGILAIAAAKLGAAQVDGVDVDAQAVETTLANAQINGVALRAALADELPATHYDVVVANILAQPLILLAPLLATRGRRIALSGLLDEQAGEVAQAYERWFVMKEGARQDNWVLLEGEHR